MLPVNDDTAALLSLGESAPDRSAPAWFRAALDAPVDQGTVDVAGAPISFRAWGEPGERGVVLVHGTAAHARWWDHIGPLLATGRRVVALDLSGHGDSGRREEYGLDLWAEEALAAARAAGVAGRPILIGHSLGGLISLRAAALFGPSLDGIVVVDSPVFEVPPDAPAAPSPRSVFGGGTSYPTREAALLRFRPVPDHPMLPWVRSHVADHSVREGPMGWTWKFDPGIFEGVRPTVPLFVPVGCRVAAFRAEQGIMTAPMTDLLAERLGRPVVVVEVPAAGHHVLLDEPLALLTGVRTLLSDWEHARPMITRRST